jgi:hypothetical protein
MLRFIEHISPDEYWFSGVFGTPSTPGTQRPLTVTGTFLQEVGHLLFEGTYRFTQGSTSHPFSWRVHSYHPSAASVEVGSGLTGQLSGHLYELGSGFELLATGTAGHGASAHIELLSDRGLRVTGVILVAGESIGFVATGAPGADRENLGNVVGILGGRRA